MDYNSDDVSALLNDVRAFLNDSGEHTKEHAIAKAKEVVNGLDEELNIAVTGETGAGKSSFVNAIRGVKVGEEGFAPVGVTETTIGCNMYSHPNMPNVRIWDLPGIGSPSFKAKTYTEDVEFKKYDFYIIVSASRFKDDDTKLAEEIKKQDKNFYFVRSKIDQDVRNGIEYGGSTEEETLRRIRDDCLAKLKKMGPPPIYLITSHDLSKFDFHNLVETLMKDLPRHKMYALLLSLPVYSMQSLKKKYNMLKKIVWAVAAVSGSIAAIPVPGLSTACDIAMIVFFLTKCYFSFGLEDKTLRKLSQIVNKPILEVVRESSLVLAIANKTMLKTSMVAKMGGAGVIEALCSLVPIAGNSAAAGVSFLTTRCVLQEGLDELYRAAKKVIEMAELE